MSRDEQNARRDFGMRYAETSGGVIDEIERRVIGGTWGANGYTTMDQADLLVARLGLSPQSHLLDLGTGRGWPGLYVASKTGCTVTVTDLPSEGVTAAVARGGQEAVNLTGGVVASAARLPFADGSFDAVVHTDVLC